MNAIHQKQGERALRGFSFFPRAACCLVLFCLFGSAVQAASAEEAPYSIIDLGTLRGSDSTGLSLNNSGQVVGWSLDRYGRRRAFLHTAGKTIDIGTLGGSESSASDISETGIIVGYSHLPTDAGGDQARRAFRYANGTMEDLGTLGGQESIATAVNATGDVVGYAGNSADEVRGFRTVGAAMRDIGQLSDYSFNIYPASVNNAGQVVGTAPNGKNLLHAFLYAQGTMRDLGTLGGNTSFATRINQRGDVAGYAETATGEEHAFLFSPGKRMRDLGTLGGRISRAFGLNNRRQAVGYSVDAQNAPQLAFAYEASAGMKDLNSFLPENSGWTLRSANGINDRAQITGWGSIGGKRHAFLMTPNFPKAAVLDPFGRGDGKLGPDWVGDTQSYAFALDNGLVRVGTGGAIYWKSDRFRKDQEAFVRFERISPWSIQGLALKVAVFGQGAPDARNGGIVILYDARRKFAQMGTILPSGRGWRLYRPIRVEFQDGDQFGARVYATGEVRIYKNHWPIETIPLAPADADFFGSRGGAVGIVSFPAAGQTAFSEFGGGNVPD